MAPRWLNQRWLGVAGLAAFIALLILALEFWPLLPYHTMDFITIRLSRYAGIRVSPYFDLLHAPAQGAGHEERDREQVDCAEIPRGARTAVLLIFGQSNAGNHGEAPYKSTKTAYNLNFYTGRCFVARDPLLGATGNGGSLGSALADQLLSDGLFDSVLLVPIAVSASTIEDWAPRGQHHRRLVKALGRIHQAGFGPTHLIWHQGEANTRWNANAAVYTALFHEMLSAIRDQGIKADVFVPLASVCHAAADPITRQGQAALVDPAKGIHPGPDTDTLDDKFRYDNCHFSTRGMELHARLWALTLRRHIEAGPDRTFARVTAQSVQAGPPQPDRYLSLEATPGRSRAWHLGPLSFSTILPATPTQMSIDRDAMLFRLHYVPAKPGAHVAVRVQLGAKATQRNTVVIALFRSDNEVPIALFRDAVGPDFGTYLDRQTEIVVEQETPVDLIGYIGLARPGGQLQVGVDESGNARASLMGILDLQQVD